MKINLIKFSKEFPQSIGNQWIGIEAEPDPGQDPDDCFKEIVSKINQWGGDKPTYGAVVPDINIKKEVPVGDILAGIQSCTELNVLATYRFLATKNPEWLSAYEKKYTELTK